MTRSDFIQEIKNQVEILKTERSEVKKLVTTDYDTYYHKYNKLGHEISALENAIREMETK